MERKIIKTLHGDHTIFVPELNEHYHSTTGAIEEALHVYIQHGLKNMDTDKISVLEIGFGTGLNAFLSALYAKENNIEINYTGIEKYPLERKILSELNYADFFENSQLLFTQITDCHWGENNIIHPYFSLTKTEADINDIILPENTYDIVFYDAFAPDKQPDMWTEILLQNIYNSLKINGILTTYTAKGFVKQNLRNVGFTVKRLKGAGQKRHMLNALKL